MITSIKIQTDLISRPDLDALCATILEATLRFYENQDNKKEFERWLLLREGGEKHELGRSRRT